MKKKFEKNDLFDWRKGNFDFELSIEMLFCEIFKIFEELSRIAHSIANFILKKRPIKLFLIKMISYEI